MGDGRRSWVTAVAQLVTAVALRVTPVVQWVTAEAQWVTAVDQRKGVTAVARWAKAFGMHYYIAGSIPAVSPRYCTTKI